MRSLFRVAVALLLAALVVGAPGGCGKKQGKPNPELEIPDIPPSERSTKGGGPLKPPGK
jgi:hypothetical protein